MSFGETQICVTVVDFIVYHSMYLIAIYDKHIYLWIQ